MTHKTAEDFIKQADLEIERGDWPGAWKIAVQALKHFPDHAQLQKYEHILAPPKVTSVDRGGHPEIRADREWLQQNRPEYRGRWVGIKNGQLLAVGTSHDEIIAQVGPVKNTGILVTKVY